MWVGVYQVNPNALTAYAHRSWSCSNAGDSVGVGSLYNF